MLMQTCLDIINGPTLARDMMDPDMVALKVDHNLGNRVAKIDMTLVQNTIVALALVAEQNHAAPDVAATTQAPWLIAMGDRNSDLHAARIEIAPAWAP
ncbi:MAG TPA: hypothetical protein VGM98_09310 [Schlesneria sp.]|jgi:hypothetical protein